MCVYLNIAVLSMIPASNAADLRNDVNSITQQRVYINSYLPSPVNIAINNTYEQHLFSPQALKSFADRTKQTAMHLKDYVAAYCKENKGFLIAGVVAGLYSILFGRLLYLHYVLSDTHQWSLWKNECTLQQLCAMHQKELAKELLIAIQQRYSTPTTMQDFFKPLVSFFNDLEGELKLLKQFETLHNRIDRLYLTSFFPAQQQLRTELPERINRTVYFKQLLTTWIAEYKVAATVAQSCI